MRLLGNPVLLRAVVVLFCSTFAFLVGLLFIRELRKRITEEGNITGAATPTLETLPLHLYNTVIQQLKQQKHELQVQSKAEQHRARTTKNFSQSVLSNLPCGVLVFGTNGLVKTSNPSAKAILGFASAVGMGAQDIFRGAEVRTGSKVAADALSNSGGEEPILLWEEIGTVLRQDSKRREVEAEYETPAGEKRFIAVTISPVPSVDGGLLGVACLINDLSELQRIRLQQEVQGELSAEMAVQLRSSLATISGYAQEIAGHGDPELAMQRAREIANEATQLNRSVDGFLTRTEAAKGAAAGRSTD